MSNLYEIVEKKNKEIEALKKEITKPEESKAYFENRIREEEESNSSNDLNKELKFKIYKIKLIIFISSTNSRLKVISQSIS